ncbi:H-SHIPPO 1 [Histomonas meleagridis]|uniref:H-SHIPPO 1 n=1 Tax=Histomonas meleagridis TaxID=135588 RepID=UPI0035594DB9|nr:H-SHIPPO 1 [Histomonas meleagridis]KAH0799912.1 H-SHIPPO 1 [Histomonas meleagridis]
MLFSLGSERKFSNVIKNTPEEVGPGKYNVTSEIGNKKKMKAPFGSRASRDMCLTKTDDNPAPGKYEAKPLNQSVAITSVFNSESKRDVFPTISTPSPAQYGHIEEWVGKHPKKVSRTNLPTRKTSSGYVGQDVIGYIQSGDGNWVPVKQVKHGPEWIGPGSYDTNNPKKTSLSISLDRSSKRDLFLNRESNPGPGSYSPSDINSKIPVAISPVPRNNRVSDGGSSGFVSPKVWVTPEQESSPMFKYRGERKIFDTRDSTPGPAAYYRYNRRQNSIGGGFELYSDRHSLQPLNRNPGPGSYNTNSKWVKNKHSALPRAQSRSVDSKEWVPGPGKYNTTPLWDHEYRPSSVFKSCASRSRKVDNSNPGPGSYSPQITDSAHHIPMSIHESRFEKHGDWIESSKIETPSPDSYQKLDSDLEKGRTIPRTYRENRNVDNFPGPGAYNVVHGSFKTKSHNAAAIQDMSD